MLEMKIFPSLLSANFLELLIEIQRLEHASANGIHLDVMDGHFVPNLSFGLPLIKQISKSTNLFLDGHLMISNPDKWVEAYCDAGVHSLSIHYETTKNLKETLQKIKNKGVRAGLALNPSTNPSEIADDIYIENVDYILLMSVEPGFGGQSFMPNVLEKIRYLRMKFPDKDIEIDGGIHYNPDSTGKSPAYQVTFEGANIIVAGSAVFNEEYKEENYQTPLNRIIECVKEGHSDFLKNNK